MSDDDHDHGDDDHDHDHGDDDVLKYLMIDIVYVIINTYIYINVLFIMTIYLLLYFI